MAQKICEMRIMISTSELAWFKENFPGIKWEAGDTTIKWNANDPEEVAMAKKAYEAYKKKHPKAVAYKAKTLPNGKVDKKDIEKISGFDPNAEFILIQEWMQKG